MKINQLQLLQLQETASDAVSSTLNRARAMLNTSIARGNFGRLNQRERLRSQEQASKSRQGTRENKRARVEKTFEFVLVDVSDCESDETWSISNEIIVLRGVIDISTESKEEDIRKEIGNAVRLKYPAVNDSDFKFLRANRRKLSKPVNCKG